MIMKINGKCSDMFGLRCEDIDYNGYVLHGLGIGGGDYIALEIDLETGQIQDWIPLTKDDIRKAIDES